MDSADQKFIASFVFELNRVRKKPLAQRAEFLREAMAVSNRLYQSSVPGETFYRKVCETGVKESFGSVPVDPGLSRYGFPALDSPAYISYGHDRTYANTVFYCLDGRNNIDFLNFHCVRSHELVHALQYHVLVPLYAGFDAPESPVITLLADNIRAQKIIERVAQGVGLYLTKLAYVDHEIFYKHRKHEGNLDEDDRVTWRRKLLQSPDCDMRDTAAKDDERTDKLQYDTNLTITFMIHFQLYGDALRRRSIIRLDESDFYDLGQTFIASPLPPFLTEYPSEKWFNGWNQKLTNIDLKDIEIKLTCQDNFTMDALSFRDTLKKMRVSGEDFIARCQAWTPPAGQAAMALLPDSPILIDTATGEMSSPAAAQLVTNPAPS